MHRRTPYATRPGDDGRERDADAVHCDCDWVIAIVRRAHKALAERKQHLGQSSNCPGNHDVKLCDTGLDGLDELIRSMEAERDDVVERTLVGERSAA